MSHHPPISAFYVCNRKDGFSISGSILAKSKFYGTEVLQHAGSSGPGMEHSLLGSRIGNSLSAVLDGRARLLFLSREEEYVITMPYAHCKGRMSEGFRSRSGPVGL